MRGFAALATILATLVAWIWLAASAKADYDPGCISQPWRLGLRATTRTLCDGPIQADGSWTRARQFYVPAYMVGGSSSCYNYGSGYGIGSSGGIYGGTTNCSYSEPHEVAEFKKIEVYIVTTATVLSDEPGHINEGSIT